MDHAKLVQREHLLQMLASVVWRSKEA